MLLLNIPLLMVIAFLLLTLAVGIYFSRKEISFREYAVGNKQFATATLVATVLATVYGGGSLVRTVQQVHNDGLYWIVLILLSRFDLWIISVLSLRMGPFMKHLSMPESIGSVYGKYPRIITALSSIFDSIAVTAAQISITSMSIGMFLDSVSPQSITIFSTLILIFYSSFGGIRAVIFTDVLQFVTFSIVIPLLGWFMFINTGKSISETITCLQNYEKFQLNNFFQFNTKSLGMVMMLLSFLVGFIEPPIIQRVYMASSPIQAQKVFKISTIFSFIVRVSIILIALFVFVEKPNLPKVEIWDYIMDHIPTFFKGLLAISLLAMAMSTADSKLNSCSVMVINDIVGTIRWIKMRSDHFRLYIARLATLSLGLSAMVLTFYYKDLLRLLQLSLDFSLPIATAPFILAVFGFRGTSRTALIGMATGTLTIFAWNKWIRPLTGINGSFLCMLANGLAMMAAHYLLTQPEGTGWVEPDDQFKQMKQANARKSAQRKEAIKNAFVHIKDTLAKLQPSSAKLACLGLYVIITTFLTCIVVGTMDHCYWLIPQILIGACFMGYAFISLRIGQLPGWLVGLCWAIGLAVSLPINVLWHWWHGINLLLTIGLSLAHLAVTLLLLPLYLGIGLTIITLLTAMYLSPIYCIKPLVVVISPAGVVLLLLLVLGLSLLIFSIFIYFKLKIATYFNQVVYLKGKEKLREAHKLKEAVYNSTVVPPTAPTGSNGMGTIVEKIVRTIEESISLFDCGTPLYKQDFQSIINKLYGWMTYFKKKGKAKDHMLLEATKITLDKLISKLDFALSQEVARPPRLFIESIDAPNGAVLSYIIGDVNQVLYLLVKAVLAVMDLDSEEPQFVRLQFYATHLKFEKSAPIEDNSYPSAMLFRSMALVLSNATTPLKELPTVEPYYEEVMDDRGSKEQKIAPPSIDLRKETISSIVHAHYGYLAYPTDAKQKTILLVLPTDVTAIRNEMLIKLPIDCLMSETAITPKEQADSLMVLMDFHDFVAKLSHEVDPIDLSIISGILQLLRERFGFKRHACGQLFYVRAVGIARLVTEWLFHSPKPIYASLLYGLVRNTCLPLSYIKKNYNLGVYVFVQNVLGVDKRQAMESSLLYVQNRFDKAIAQEQVQLSVLFIKLAERLYDLRHAAGYAMVEEVKYMAKETLTIDIKLAHHYLDPEIAEALEKAAKQALKICKDKAH